MTKRFYVDVLHGLLISALIGACLVLADAGLR